MVPNASPMNCACRARTSAPPTSVASGYGTIWRPATSACCVWKPKRAIAPTCCPIRKSACWSAIQRSSACATWKPAHRASYSIRTPSTGGTLKGVGKVYVQVVVDAFCSLAFAKVYTSKMPITAANLLHDRVFPFYEALGVPVQTILTDNGREFSGPPEHHPYQLFLALHDIEHRTTKIRSPRTHGFVERMNRRAGRNGTNPPRKSSATWMNYSPSITSSAATRATASRGEHPPRPCVMHSAGRSCHPPSPRRMKPPPIRQHN